MRRRVIEACVEDLLLAVFESRDRRSTAFLESAEATSPSHPAHEFYAERHRRLRQVHVEGTVRTFPLSFVPGLDG
ncbi:hypothetical protein ACFYXF_13645 [Streptomyces sp. NPDC002680]|uniref:hypothetical protein n=1 Tax=Streptomyces sp. NPDC002680 TaxID=3364659 RepID=UPI0036989F0C